MKLIRCGEIGRERPAVLLENGSRISAETICQDFNESFFDGGGLASLNNWVLAGYPDGKLIGAEVRLGPPIARPSKIICVGQNYTAHACEMGDDPPAEPVLFHKASSCWSGPFDPVTIPPGASQLDYEVELGVVIGKKAKHLSCEQANDFIAGYTVFCDFSERSFQRDHCGQWTKGKSYDTFGPAGPYLLTRDELQNSNSLDLRCSVNGEIRQQSNTSDMMKNVAELISYISQFMTLLPGDLVSTGTPSGVAMGMKAPKYLVKNDRVRCEIELLGAIENLIVSG